MRIRFEQEKVYDTSEKKESELDRVTFRKSDKGWEGMGKKASWLRKIKAEEQVIRALGIYS